MPVDGSPTSNAGLAEAIKLAKLTGAQVRLLHLVYEMTYLMSADGYGSMAVEMLASLKAGGAVIFEKARLQVEQHSIAADTILLDTFGVRLYEVVAV